MTKKPVNLFNVDIEAALIGLIMVDNTVLSSACAELNPEHFHEGALGDIFATCRDMVSRGSKATAMTLIAHYQTNEAVQKLGGKSLFANLAANAGPPISAPGYARIIRDLYIRRQMVMEAETTIKDLEALPIDETGSDYAADLSQRISDLAAQGITRKSRFTLGETITQSIDRAAQAYQFDGKRPDAVSTGIKALDSLIGGFIEGDLVVLAGRPSMGKSALAVEIGRRVAKAGVPVDFHSLEMASWHLGNRIISASMFGHKVPYQRIQWGKFSEAEFNDLVSTARAIQDWPLDIIDLDTTTIAGIRAEIARRKAKRPDLKIVVIDHLGLIKGGNDRQSRTDQVGAMTGEMKRMARQFGIVIILLAQLSRGVEQRDNKRPQMADLRESGSIEQDADLIIFPFREAYYLAREEPKPNTDEHFKWQGEMTEIGDTMEIIVAKNRQGRTGTVKVKAEMATNSFADIENDQPEMF